MLDTITFDFWNTLYELPSKEIVDNTIQNLFLVLNEADYKLPHSEVAEAFGKAWNFANDMQREKGIDIKPIGQVDKLLEFLNIDLEPKWQEEFYTAYTDTLLAYPPSLKEGVAQTLPVLAERFKLGLICNTGITPGLGLRKLMASDGILDYFTVLTFSDELGISKPKKDIFIHTLSLLDSNSKYAAHIGDDATTDVWGSKNAGMTSIWLAPLAEYPVVYADYHVRKVIELITLF
ncbi:MAG: HAD family hydrolase [Syntrophomonadaceae bacterium]|nr:HAD family hydrolase [Syntrophomonadaceae bacterium]